MRFDGITVTVAAIMLAGLSGWAWSEENMQIKSAEPGHKAPLGAHFDGQGVNFAIYSRDAQAVTLCLFGDGKTEKDRYALVQDSQGVWSGYIKGIKPGQLYGYRVDGKFAPEQGWYFNSQKLLLDPYAKQVNGPAQFSEVLYPYSAVGDKNSPDQRDSAPYMVKAAVAAEPYDWQGDRRPEIPWEDTVIYEVHVKGFSRLNPGVPEKLRGTYAGLGCPASIAHLKKLGVTAVELLPVYLCLSEPHLAKNGLSNYWGYNPVNLFIPDPRFSAGSDSRAEFRQMVKNLHAAGIEVILDVVYNHSGEAGAAGAMVSWKGIDCRTYYKMDKRSSYKFQDYTGCGNSFDLRQGAALQMVLDSLRYWVEDMHVDGFRFDLASVLGRVGEDNAYDINAPFFQALEADPVLSKVKLIAEPWDCAAGGYQIGNYPASWSEWNGEWRDTLRRFWRGDRGQVGALARKMAGSPDRYAKRSPRASINFVTCHDGFTLKDIVSYNVKHNESNGEGNRDGSNDNFSWNSGCEGETPDRGVNALRQRQVRNMLMSIAFSQGVPMILGGDEMGRTQRGNNNAYCQDNEISYLPWADTASRRELQDFTARLLQIRRENPVFRQSEFAVGSGGSISWCDRHGRAIADNELDIIGDNCLGIRLRDAKTQRDFLLAMSSESRPINFVLPEGEWQVLISSVGSDAPIRGQNLQMIPHSCYLLVKGI